MLRSAFEGQWSVLGDSGEGTLAPGIADEGRVRRVTERLQALFGF